MNRDESRGQGNVQGDPTPMCEGYYHANKGEDAKIKTASSLLLPFAFLLEKQKNASHLLKFSTNTANACLYPICLARAFGGSPGRNGRL